MTAVHGGTRAIEAGAVGSPAMVALALAVALFGAPACSSDDSQPAATTTLTTDGSGGNGGVGGAGEGGVPTGCIEIEADAFGAATVSAAGATFEPALGEAGTDRIYVALGAGVAAGTVALGAPPNENLATCQGCVFVAQDLVDPLAPLASAGALYFQVAGTLAITSAPDPASGYSGRFVGELDDVTLIRVAVDAGGTSTPVPGDCLHLEHAAIDASGWQADCAAPAEAPSQGACATAAPGHCNPLTDGGCDAAAGWVCDWSPTGSSFECFPPGAGVAACGACSNMGGPFCGPGSTCDARGSASGQCFRWCCGAADCGPGAACLGAFGGVGVCVEP